MPVLKMTLPLLPGTTEAWRRFWQELEETRRAEREASRRRAGITRERYALVETPFGAAVRATFEAEDLGRALATLAGSPAPFDRWFRAQIRALHGVDLESTDGE